VDARFLDVLHHPGQEELSAVKQCVDIDLDRIIEESIHEDFIDRLRDTRSFASVDELKTQLARDVALAAEIARGDDSLERTP
jgi:hypothetical protein